MTLTYFYFVCRRFSTSYDIWRKKNNGSWNNSIFRQYLRLLVVVKRHLVIYCDSLINGVNTIRQLLFVVTLYISLIADWPTLVYLNSNTCNLLFTLQRYYVLNDRDTYYNLCYVMFWLSSSIMFLVKTFISVLTIDWNKNMCP